MDDSEQPRRKRGSGRRKVRWSRAREEVFFNHLATTCNIRASAAMAGTDPTSVYDRRRTNPDFAAKWHDAVLLGYAMLETLLIGHALQGSGGTTIEHGLEPVDRDLALKMLGQHRYALRGRPHKGGPPPARATAEQTDAAILKKLDQIAKRRAAEA